jgi:integrase
MVSRETRHGNRTVPLGQQRVATLSSRKPEAAHPDALVFGTEKGTPFCRHNLSNRQLVPACKALGLEGIRWHSLRHLNATLLDSVGTPLGTVQALLGLLFAKTRYVSQHTLSRTNSTSV